MIKFYVIICTLFFAIRLPAQEVYKLLPSPKLKNTVYSDAEFDVFGRDTVFKKFSKKLEVMEGGDSILYVELFDVNRHWYLERYRIKDGKKYKSGWQQEYNLNGTKTFERYCSTEDASCNHINAYSYYPNGNIIAIVKTIKNKKEGNSLFYHNNGQLKNSIEFNNGKVWNVLAYYDQHGNILDPGNFCDGNGQLKVYSVTGRLIKIKNYKNGREKMFGF